MNTETRQAKLLRLGDRPEVYLQLLLHKLCLNINRHLRCHCVNAIPYIWEMLVFVCRNYAEKCIAKDAIIIL
jgi:hypothetical protein